MANIKISELDELQKATDQDLLVIVDVDNNRTKKIQTGNLGILVPKTTKTTSDTETYSCNYINGIVESGSNAYGNWIKYSDGTMIVTRETYEITVNIDVSWGNIFVGGDYTEWEFPVPFINVPDLVLFDVNPTTTNGCFKTSYEPTNITKNSIQNVYVGRGTSASDVTFKIHILAIGRWK